MRHKLKSQEEKLDEKQSIIDELQRANKEMRYNLSKTEKQVEEKEMNLETT